MWVVELNDLDRSMVAEAGGKGANLGELIRAEVLVPSGFVVTATAYKRFLEENGIRDKIIALCSQPREADDPMSLEELSKTIQDIILKGKMSKDLLEGILGHYRRLAGPEDVAFPILVAVRSSATAEDLEDASFAGQQDTYLNVIPPCEQCSEASCRSCHALAHGKCDIIRYVQQCWASLFTSRAIFYRQQRGFEHSQVHMAVVVQKMINGEKSGVIFTANPITRNRSQMVCEAVWGLGEGVVSGKINPDHYILDKESLQILKQIIGLKKTMIVWNESTGKTQELETPQERIQAEVLDPNELAAIARVGKALEDHYQAAQDIEFAVLNSEVFVLQSRPITTL